ncbi:MAG: MSMEG_0570 family nitrogen starvation response protein [Nocardiaceae bacterium]|nr:MSMEG_0570 family nitrogen starvation response protein [Nocardiaceae bacterium]
MPEMTFDVRWPDGTTASCYSPSLVMHDHLQTGTTYTVSEFVARSTTALGEAAERVKAKFGFYCTSAAETTSRITATAANFPPHAEVTVVAMHPPLVTS